MIQLAIVEDDEMLREELNFNLSRHGFTVLEANSGKGLDDILSNARVDLILLDITLPGESGLDICKRIRTQLPKIGVIMFTALPSKNLRIEGYECGADIYMTKPVNPAELKQALINLSKRIGLLNTSSEWQLNTRQLSLTGPNHIKIALTANESRILTGMIQAKDNILTIDNALIILEDGDDKELTKHALEASISRLRKKLSAAQPEIESPIKAAWGKGYKLMLPINLS